MTQQAAMIGYLNDFRLMMYLTLAVLPLLIIIRVPQRGAAVETHTVVE